MRILIISSDTGGGHRSAARAISAALQSADPGVDVVITDYLAGSGFPLALGLPGYARVVHYPGLWRLIWHGSNFAAFPRMIGGAPGSVVRRAIRLALASASPDMVVSVHPLASVNLTRVLAKRARRLPCVVVVTDLVSIHPAWAAPDADATVAPTPAARDLLLRFGVPAERISVLGLPVDRRFATASVDKPALRRQLGLSEEPFTVLMVGGGEGAGHLERLVEALDARLAEAGLNAQMVVVAGRNQALKTRLTDREWRLPVHVTGFVDNLHEWMSAADLLVTKAGPGTIAEALTRGLPLILSSLLPGQEDGNVGYVVDGGCGLWLPEPGAMAAEVARLASADGRARVEAMSAAALRMAHPRAAEEIAALILRVARSANLS